MAYVAELLLFAGNLAPRGFALCNGQILPISQNTALFSLLGTNYGGNGTSNFGLPNMQGAIPLHAGQGPGLSPYVIGETGGSPAVTVLTTQLPAHTHVPNAQPTADATKDSAAPVGAIWGVSGERRSTVSLYSTTAGATNMAALPAAGGNQPHNNMPPYLALSFCIALQGIFPPRG